MNTVANRRVTTMVVGLTVAVGAEIAQADIATDGSVGTAQTLSGPNFQIDAALGSQQGNNLFHSFAEFNLDAQQSATFSGPAQLQHIIARITDGNASSIDGLVSVDNAAQLWLFNANGLVLGANAQFDLQGALHLGAASGVNFADGSRFGHATGAPNNPSTLTVALPETFSNSGVLQLQGSQLQINAPVELAATHIHFNDSAQLQTTNQNIQVQAERFTMNANSLLSSSTGANAGTITIRADAVQLNGATIDANNGAGQAGAIDIQAQQLQLLAGSQLEAKTGGAQNSGAITIVVTDQLEVIGQTTADGSRSAINVDSEGAGTGGTLNITAAQLLVDNAFISSDALATGAGGQVNIQAQRLEVRNGGFISSSAFAAGDAGSVDITVTGDTIINGPAFVDDFAGGLLVDTLPPAEGSTSSSGNGGNLQLQTQRLLMSGGSILANTSSDSQAGNVLIIAGAVSMSNGAAIVSSSDGSGAGGQLQLQINGPLQLHGNRTLITSEATATGAPGNIQINAQTVVLDGALITAENTGSGQAGNIDIDAGQRLDMSNGAELRGRSENAGGGNITIQAVERVYLHNAQISAAALGTDNSHLGGNIFIDPQFVVLNNARLSARAVGGDGGVIDIIAGQILISTDSSIDASSEVGFDGFVFLDGPELDLTEHAGQADLAAPTPARLLPSPCARLNQQDRRSSLTQQPAMPPTLAGQAQQCQPR